ncbi:protein neprosin-like [Aristolochia californica]|uniref:protein neprosin-like n=1 Tax=Aristolochia californica TaxID=171875 RepID=UPI0035DE56ED
MRNTNVCYQPMLKDEKFLRNCFATKSILCLMVLMMPDSLILIRRSRDSVATARLLNNSLFTLLLILAFVSHGFCEVFDVSVEEDVKMKKYLASVNKPPVTTITTKAGDVFDCIDINKQPSLDHPLLRNHTVQVANRGPVLYTVEVGWYIHHVTEAAMKLASSFSLQRMITDPEAVITLGGFVQVDRKITPGMILPKVSTYDGTQEEITIFVYKNDTSGDRWLRYEDGNGYVPVGYWPNILFNSLAKDSNRITWGGETTSFVVPHTTYVPMGSGSFPAEGYKKAAYMSNMKVIDSNMQFIKAPSNLIPITPTPHCYKLGNNAGDVATIGQHFYFGGLGGTS